MRTFDIGEDLHGVHIVTARGPLSISCMSPQEIDLSISSLKADLDLIAERMTMRLKARAQEKIL